MNLLLKGLLSLSFLSSFLVAAEGYQVSICPAPNTDKICFNGNPIFLSGMNLAWFSFSQDVGRQGADGALLYVDESKVRKAFQDLRKAGGNTIRWWLYTNNAMDPYFDAENKTVGIEESTTQNVKTVLDIAAEYGVVVSICLLSFDMAKKDSYSPNVAEGWSRYNYEANNKMLTDTTYTRAFIDHAVLPLVKQFKDHPGLLTWEIFNEPEGMTSTDNFGANWGTELIDIKYIQRFINMLADAIHNEAPKNLVSNGSAKTTMTSDVVGTNYYTDALLLASNGNKYQKGTLDFYQVHYYPEWNNNAESPFHHPASYWQTSKPLVIGEFPAADWNQSSINKNAGSEDRRMTLDSAYHFAYQNGYAGALSWMIVGETPAFYAPSVWSLESSTSGLTYLYDNYTDEIKLKDVVIEDNTGKNGVMEVTYTNAASNSQILYTKGLDLTGASSVYFTVKNSGSTDISYMLVLKTGAADNWGWYQGDTEKCVIAANTTKTCNVKLSSIAKWDDASAVITSHLSQIAEVFLVATTEFNGVVYIDNMVSDNNVIIHDFNEQYDVFSPTGDEAASIKTATRFDVEVISPIVDTRRFSTKDHLIVSRNVLQFNNSKTGFYEISLFDLNGKNRTILHQGLLNAGVNEFSLSSLPKGLYFVVVKGNGLIIQKPSIIQ